MKKLGKAKADLDKECWVIDDKPFNFYMNRRIIESREDVKNYMVKYKKLIHTKRPMRNKPIEREEYFKTRAEGDKQLKIFMTFVFKDILKDSFEFPIAMRLDRDYDHNSDWRYCLYKGLIYQFDKPNLSIDEMVRQIEKLEAPKLDTPAT